MVSSSALSVDEYIAELTEGRAAMITTLRNFIINTLQPGFEEVMAWGMIGYQVPLEISGPTYNGQPLAAVALASQKQHVSLYLLGIYASNTLSREFQERWSKSGKKLNMGKSCVRFRTLDAVDMDTVEWAIGLMSPKEFADIYLQSREQKRDM